MKYCKSVACLLKKMKMVTRYHCHFRHQDHDWEITKKPGHSTVAENESV